MGKVDDLRAMREARYAAATRAVKSPTSPARAQSAPASGAPAPAAGPGKAGKTAKLRVVTATETVELPATAGAEPTALFAVPGGAETGGAEAGGAETGGAEIAAAGEALCGHRAISGKTCIREDRHAEKNHRYAKA